MSTDPFHAGRSGGRPGRHPAPRAVSWAQTLAVFCFGASILMELGPSEWHWPLWGHGWPILILDGVGALLMAGSLVLLWAARRR
ncbi:hypothetical protein [Nguyenibacter sp. L1]|uniref:hypothetical protein n=1 Tax=Nguyenibacter sp. L1 TaxID=3049350 RepID=UPI002B466FBF|nr:hypothetical protein [Nguyenibacter sp. L1]WRH86389.1 hypothetical protein QN315_10035 [Nguyenibacter sp. L1]